MGLLAVENQITWSLLTDGVEFNALIAQVLRMRNDIVLGLAVCDKYTNSLGVGPHPNAFFEIVLENVVQSQTCNEDEVNFWTTLYV